MMMGPGGTRTRTITITTTAITTTAITTTNSSHIAVMMMMT
jgi:hypothetical protein